MERSPRGARLPVLTASSLVGARKEAIVGYCGREAIQSWYINSGSYRDNGWHDTAPIFKTVSQKVAQMHPNRIRLCYLRT
jgi:hypothetical protein